MRKKISGLNQSAAKAMQRLLLALLALLWGVGGFALMNLLSFTGGGSYPTASGKLEFALITGSAALPFLIGVFVVHSTMGGCKYLRWLCAVLLFAQGAFLFYFTVSWLTMIAWPPFLGVLLLLRIEIKWVFNKAYALIPLDLRLKAVKSMPLIKLISVCIIGVLFGYHWTHNSLESDEQMIAYFKAHRADFEYLVNSHRNLPESNRVYGVLSTWHQSPEIQAIKKRLKIKYINEMGLISPPDQKTPDAFKAGKVKVRKTAALGIILENQINDNSWLHLCLGMGKHYVNFPVTPNVEQGQLLFPWDTGRVRTEEKPDRVLDSLNGYPALERRECMYRRIEAQWFIEMCNKCEINF